MLSPCQNCKVICCKKFIIPLTVFDIYRIENKTNKKAEEFCIFIDYKTTDDKLFWPIFFLDLKNNLEEKLIVLKKEGDECIFLKSKSCSLWGTHPGVCRVYPFFFDRENKNRLKYVENFICPRKWSEDEIKNYNIKQSLEEFEKELEIHNKIVRRWNVKFKEKKQKQFLEYIKNELKNLTAKK